MDDLILHFGYENCHGPHAIEYDQTVFWVAREAKVYYPVFKPENNLVTIDSICVCSLDRNGKALFHTKRGTVYYSVYKVNLVRVLVTADLLEDRIKALKVLKKTWGSSYPRGFSQQENEYLVGLLVMEDLDLIIRRGLTAQGTLSPYSIPRLVRGG